MKEGPQYLRTTDLAALAENPHLWQLIMSQVHGGAGVGRAADAAGRGGKAWTRATTTTTLTGRKSRAGSTEAGAGAEVTCRVN